MSGYSLLILYLRISVEDMDHNGEDKDESNSIVNQRELLRRYVEDTPELGRYQVMELCDDGYSGTSMERPGMEKLLDMAKKGQVGCILVKDFSRFGRNYIEAGNYIQKIFPFLGVRFISVTDRFDSLYENGDDLGVNLKNLANEMYAKDIAVKVKAARKAQWEKGSYTGSIPAYGYRGWSGMMGRNGFLWKRRLRTS